MGHTFTVGDLRWSMSGATVAVYVDLLDGKKPLYLGFIELKRLEQFLKKQVERVDILFLGESMSAARIAIPRELLEGDACGP